MGNVLKAKATGLLIKQATASVLGGGVGVAVVLTYAAAAAADKCQAMKCPRQ